MCVCVCVPTRLEVCGLLGCATRVEDLFAKLRHGRESLRYHVVVISRHASIHGEIAVLVDRYIYRYIYRSTYREIAVLLDLVGAACQLVEGSGVIRGL